MCIFAFEFSLPSPSSILSLTPNWRPIFCNPKLLFVVHLLGCTSLLCNHPLADVAKLSLTACDYTLDLELQALSIEWGISGCGEHQVAYNRPVDVYLNSASNRSFSYDPKRLPTGSSLGPEYIRELSSFKTKHDLHPSTHKTDLYTLHLFAFAIDPSTNLSINIHRFELPNSLDGFTISSSASIVAKEFSYITTNGFEVTGVDSSTLMVEIKRSDLSQALNACILVTSWALTLGLAYVTVTGARNGRVDFTVLFLYVSVALAIASLRRLLVSPPLFGEYVDTVGFLSQITVMTLSSVALAYNFLKPYPSPKIYPRSLKKI